MTQPFGERQSDKAMIEIVAKEIWRYSECSWDYANPPEGMAQLQKQICIDEAANICVAILNSKVFRARVSTGFAAELYDALLRARTVLDNMAWEHTGWRSFFTRWCISDEPLRNDAQNLLPLIDKVLGIDEPHLGPTIPQTKGHPNEIS